MYKLRRLYYLNLIAYGSFLIYFLLGLHQSTFQHRIYFLFIPVVLLFFSLFIFDSTRDYRLKYIRFYSVPDFVVRLISLELCVVGSMFSKSRLGLTMVLITFIILFAINLSLEKLMSIGIHRHNERVDNRDKYTEENGLAIISIGMSYVETILLLFMLLLPFNLTSSLEVSGYIIWASFFVVLLSFYIRQTLQTLYKYYKKEKDVRHFLLLENGSILLLFIGLSLYGYFLGFSTFADGIFYLTSLLMLLPRQITRIKRLSDYNEARGGKYAEVVKPEA